MIQNQAKSCGCWVKFGLRGGRFAHLPRRGDTESLSLAHLARQSQVFGSSPNLEPAMELGVEPATVKCATDDAS
ncbi:MAG TPA: hypothetical protein VLA84_23050, partial [Microcoleus sp.]|nr:hypothetical protein [Microcoleus sp.]